jgi:hypothetical protein
MISLTQHAICLNFINFFRAENQHEIKTCLFYKLNWSFKISFDKLRVNWWMHYKQKLNSSGALIFWTLRSKKYPKSIFPDLINFVKVTSVKFFLSFFEQTIESFFGKRSSLVSSLEFFKYAIYEKHFIASVVKLSICIQKLNF